MALSKKLFASLAVCALSVAGLAACSNANTGAGGKEPTKQGKVEIEYLHRLDNAENATKVDEIVKKWNADNPDIQVKAVKFDGKAQELIQKVDKDIKANNAPCLYQAGYADLAELYVKGMVQDVTQYAGQYKNDFGAGPFESMAINGKYFGIPQDTGPLVYFYDKAQFDALGLSVPTTADEFIETAKKAVAQGKFIVAFNPDEGAQIYTSMVAGAGDQWFSVDGDAWKIDTAGQGSAKVADFWQKLLDAKAAKVINRWTDTGDMEKAMANGELIGAFGAAWDAPLLADGIKGSADDGKWAIAQMPDFGAGAGKTGPNGGSGVVVSKTCEFPEQAMKFNAWFNTQVNDLATQGLVVAAKATPSAPAYASTFGGQDILAEFVKANENMNAFTFPPSWSVPQGFLSGDQNAKAGAGAVKVADVFKGAADEAKKALTDAGLDVK
ncbi:MAG: extracellular solute-binding protein [Actinomycetaceae bacterium]|nr:extracellular solute-binding protein [Actinomycetaceae bacterium]